MRKTTRIVRNELLELKIVALLLLIVFLITSVQLKLPLVSLNNIDKVNNDLTNNHLTGFVIREGQGQGGQEPQNYHEPFDYNPPLIILNPESRPSVFDNWTINFVMKEQGTLIIRGVNGTFFEYDVKPISLLCDGKEIGVIYKGAKLYYDSLNCSRGSLTLLVLTSGRHNIEFLLSYNKSTYNKYGKNNKTLTYRAFAHNYACNSSTMPVIHDTDQVGYEGKPYTKYMNVTDPENYTIVFYDIYISAGDNFSIKINNQTGLINFTPLDSDFGNHYVEYIARNNMSCTGYKWLNFYIYDKPNITSNYPNQTITIDENTTQTFNVTVLDRNENNTLNYSWYYDNTLIDSGINKSSINISFDYCSSGQHNITLIVNNSYNLSTQFIWQVNVNNKNRPPVFNLTIQNYSWNEGSSLINAFNLSDHFFDYDTIECGDDSLTFNVTQVDNITITINNQSPFNVSFSSDPYWFGNRTVIFYAYDSNNSFNQSNNVTLTVLFVNHPPSIGYNNKTTYKGSRLSFQINASDPDLPYDSLNYTYQLLDSFPEFSMNSSGFVNFTAETIGNHTVNITVTDSHGGSDSKLVMFTILNNSPPVFLELPNNTTKLSNETYYYEVNASDPDNDTITYSVESNNTFPSLSINQTSGIMNFSLTKCDVGNHTVTITIIDSKNATNQTTFNFEVINVPSTPQIQDFTPKHTRTNKNFSVVIEAIDDDLDCPGDNLNFSLNTTYSNKFSITNINNTNNYKATLSVYSNETGNYSLRIIVFDSYGLNDTFDFVFEITPNHPPEIIDDVITANATQLFTYQVQASDYDNDDLVFNYSTNITNFYMTPQGIINFTPQLSDVGNHTLYVNVSDGINTTEKNITFVIQAPNHPPQLFINDLNATAGELFTYQVNASDVDNDSLTFTYDFIGSNISNFNMNSTGFINFTPLESDIGTYQLRINVSDGKATNSSTINFTIYWQNHEPTITSKTPNTNLTISEGSIITLNITAEDIDIAQGDNLTITWLINGSGTNRSVSSTQQSFSGNTTTQSLRLYFDYCSSGSYNVTVIVKDSLNNQTTTSWNITVNNTNRIPYFGIKKYSKIMSESAIVTTNTTITTTNTTENTVAVTTQPTQKTITLSKPQGSQYYYQRGSSLITIDFKAENSNYAEIEFNSLIINYSLPNQTNMSVEVRTSPDNTTWSSWALISIINNRTGVSSSISPESQRYLQLRINLSTQNTTLTPSVNNITITYEIADVSFPENTNPWWVNLDYFFYDDDSSCGDDSLTYSTQNLSNVGINIVNSRVQLIPTSDGTGYINFTAIDENNETISSNRILLNVTNVAEIEPQVIYSTSTTTTTEPLPIINY